MNGGAHLILIIKRRDAFIDKRKLLHRTVANRIRQLFLAFAADIRILQDTFAENAFPRIQQVGDQIKYFHRQV